MGQLIKLKKEPKFFRYSVQSSSKLGLIKATILIDKKDFPPIIKVQSK